MRFEGRLADRALVLATASFNLLTPPVVGLFAGPVLVFGIPLLLVYCFGVWLLVILLGGRLAAHLDAAGAARTGGAEVKPDAAERP